MKTRNMTEGSPIRLLLAVAFPLMLGNVFQQLYTVVDAQVVGAVEGPSAMASTYSLRLISLPCLWLQNSSRSLQESLWAP